MPLYNDSFFIQFTYFTYSTFSLTDLLNYKQIWDRKPVKA